MRWVPGAHTSHTAHAGQGAATSTSDSPASLTPSCCLCYSLANLFQPLINTLLIPPPQFHLTNHSLRSGSSESRGCFFPLAAPTMINRCWWSTSGTTSLLDFWSGFSMALVVPEICLPTQRGDGCWVRFQPGLTKNKKGPGTKHSKHLKILKSRLARGTHGSGFTRLVVV